MNVYQYIGPHDSDADANTRWIAAETATEAAAYAMSQGWRESGGQIYDTRQLRERRCYPEDPLSLATFGCDVMIFKKGNL